MAILLLCRDVQNYTGLFISLQPRKSSLLFNELFAFMLFHSHSESQYWRPFSNPKKQNPVQYCGLHFQNPVGLGAGFDKNARYLSELEALGFGFVEIGTVTPLPQDGNEKPRLFRLPKDKALINRMGFNNEGMEKIAAAVKRMAQKKSSKPGLIIGGNIGKNKNTPNEEAWKDYEKCFLAAL
ncbi:MAG: hypothetical protein V9E88_07715 [Ferruginibacter sp.]